MIKSSNIYILIILYLSINTALSGQENAEMIFNKATEQLVSENMELVIEMNITDSKGRVKEKGFNILSAKFGEIEKMKVIWQKPKRAKGTSIIITTPPTGLGLIEVYTPSNGKIRKMKATSKNMELMGSDFNITNMRVNKSDELIYSLLDKENVNDRSCFKIEVKDEQEVGDSKGELLIEETTYRIVQVTIFDDLGNKSSISKLSEFQEVEGINNKTQAMRILTENFENKKITDIRVLKMTYKPNLNENDFVLLKEIAQ